MIQKPLDRIEKADVDSLIANEEREDRALECKQALPTNSDDDKRELLADVSSFANAAVAKPLRAVNHMVLSSPSCSLFVRWSRGSNLNSSHWPSGSFDAMYWRRMVTGSLMMWSNKARALERTIGDPAKRRCRRYTAGAGLFLTSHTGGISPST
jgi:hypothetical protein